MEDLVGKKIESYEILGLIGKGGMGVVYLAHDLRLDRRVAIKFLSPTIMDNSRFIERFKREAKNQAQLSHPNIVTVYGFLEYQNLLGIVMEFVDGESLDKLIYRQKRLHIYDAIYFVRQILSGLGYAHAKGFVHRDIKPSNIIMNREGVAKIVDFGISKSLFDAGDTQTGAKVGTVLYMSPEQIKGKGVTHRSDIYSIGCTMYEMLVGQPPFYQDSEYDVMDGHLKGKHKKVNELLPGTSLIIDKIIDRSLAKDPNARYNDCGDFLDSLHELDKYLSEQQNKIFDGNKKKKKSKFWPIAAMITFFVTMIGLSYFVYNQVDALLKSDQIDEIKKYSFNSIFDESDNHPGFSEIVKQKTNTFNKINSVHFIDETHGFALGDSGTVLITNNGGENWNDYAINKKVSVKDGYFSASGKSILIGDSTYFLFSDNNLASVSNVTLNGDYTLFRIKFINSVVGFVLGNKGLILKTDDGGITWRRINSNSNQILYDIAFVDNNNGFIVGWNGTLLKTVDGGESFLSVTQLTKKYHKSIDFWDKFGVIVGGSGEIYITSDSGNEWELVKIDKISGLQKVKFITEDLVVAIGSKGNMLISNNSGATWKLLDKDIFVDLTDLNITPNGKIFLSGDNGTILKMM